MATDPDAIDTAFFDELRKHFSEPEIVELGLFIGFTIMNVGLMAFCIRLVSKVAKAH